MVSGVPSIDSSSSRSSFESHPQSCTSDQGLTALRLHFRVSAEVDLTKIAEYRGFTILDFRNHRLPGYIQWLFQRGEIRTAQRCKPQCDQAWGSRKYWFFMTVIRNGQPRNSC